MAGQDIKKVVPAGGGMPISTGGDYIYLKFADRPIDVIMTGGRSGQTRVTMEAGDKYRPGSFNSFEIHNPDPDNAAAVIFTVGEGDYNRQIVQGEISVIPGIRAADGSFIEDTRWTLAADVDLTNITPKNYTKKSPLVSYGVSQNVVSIIWHPEAKRFFWFDNNNNAHVYDPENETSSNISSDDYPILSNGDTSHVISEFRGCLGPDGSVWLGARASGTLATDKKAAAVRVDKDLNILESVNTNALADDYGETNPIYPVFNGDQLYILVGRDNQNAITDVYQGNQLVGTIEQGFANKGAHEENGFLVIPDRATSNPKAVYDFTTLTKQAVSLGDYINLDYGGMIMPDRRFVRAEADAAVRVFNSETWTRTAQGTFETCAGGYAFNPEEQQTEAGITGEQTDKGVVLTGEVLRAMLELWLGQFVADDYLDHIYRVEFDNANGRAPVTVSSGGTSFAGAKIADSFRCVFPQTIKITLDNNLTTKA